MTTAVVFAYHNVGVRCLQVLLAHGVNVPLVVTHPDDPTETRWFESVAEVAARFDLPTIRPENPNTPELVAQIRALKPDFLFSFYYRQMISPALLEIPIGGALNLHGSLLPHYRGRVPVNWAVLHGETQTGATLHHMVEKPDAGDIVGQTAVPILPDDTAQEVFHKVTWAAELTLHQYLPMLIAGTAPRRAQNLAEGGYFSGRKPEDGRIDWRAPAATIHNLVRAVAPPYPGAFTALMGQSVRILRTCRVGKCADLPKNIKIPCLTLENDRVVVYCADNERLALLSWEIAGEPMTPPRLITRCGIGPWPLDT